MSAAMELHVALSLRLDAIEAYRLAHAYRDEELQKFADRLASRASLYGDSRTVIEVIRDLRQLAGEKASAPAPTATPTVFDPLPSYLHAIGHAGSESERGLYAAYAQAIAEVARLQAETGSSNQPAEGEAAPGLNDRQTRLLDAIRGERGHWKTGRVLRFYQHNEFHGAIRTARSDLEVLRDTGHITQHDTKGVRFYTYRAKGSRP